MHYRRIDEIRYKIEVLDKLRFQGRRPLPYQALHAGDYIDLPRLGVRGFRAPARGGKPSSTPGVRYYRGAFKVPGDFAGREIALVPARPVNGLLYLDGEPFQGLDIFHPYAVIAAKSIAGRRHTFLIEAIQTGNWATAPAPDMGGISLVVVNRPLWDLYFDALTLLEIAEALPPDRPRKRTSWQTTLNSAGNERPYDESERAERILAELEEALNRLSWHCVQNIGRRKEYYFDRARAKSPSMAGEPAALVPDGDEAKRLAGEAAEARRLLAPLLHDRGAERRMALWLAPNSHLDVIWLWPFQETVRKMARTTCSMLRALERYPRMRFIQGQAVLYDALRKNYPGVFRQVRDAVRRGRWEAVGGLWVEPDTHMPSGESLVRQIVIGKRFFRDVLGVDVRTAWLPDVFGLSGNLPQLLRLSGFDGLFTAKQVTNEYTRFPHTLFMWEGIDGAALPTQSGLSYYNDDNRPEIMLDYLNFFREKGRCDGLLMPYGPGDGGGGPTDPQCERAERLADQPGLPRLENRPVSEFFAGLKKRARLPRYAGEIYLGAHRGTFTTMAGIKRLNRQAEARMREVELLAAMLGAEADDKAWRETAWKQILLHQFHDVITGACVGRCRREAEDALRGVVAECLRRRGRLLEKLSGRDGGKRAPAAFNPLAWERVDLLNLPQMPGGRQDAAGTQRAADGSRLCLVRTPSFGFGCVANAESAISPIHAGSRMLSNGRFTLRFDRAGRIISLRDRLERRELIPAGARGNELRLHSDPVGDAWEISEAVADTFRVLRGTASIAVLEPGPLRATLRIERAWGASRLRQDVSVYSHTDRIDFRTTVDWREEGRMLRVAFPAPFNATHARCEIQFGHILRPVRRNNEWERAMFEVPCQRWADISDGGYGLALLNDARHGYSVQDGWLGLSLLRATTLPDCLPDRGSHEFTYSLLPHPGDFMEGHVVREASALNAPLVPCRANPARAGRPWLSVDAPNVVIETVKPAEDARGIVARLYEVANRSTRAVLKGAFTSATETDLLERPLGLAKACAGSLPLAFRPFEIKTLRLGGMP